MGLSHAAALCEEGAAVVMADILDEEGLREARALEARGQEARFLHLDVRSPEEWKEAAHEALNTFGHIDVLVNNAGICKEGGAVDESKENWDLVIAVNQTGV